MTITYDCSSIDQSVLLKYLNQSLILVSFIVVVPNIFAVDVTGVVATGEAGGIVLVEFIGAVSFTSEVFADDGSVCPSILTGSITGPPGESGNLAVSTSTPVSVTNKVCSTPPISGMINQYQILKDYSPNCALLLPSSVTEVQLSGQVLSLLFPKQIIGSIVKQVPGLASPTALFLA